MRGCAGSVVGGEYLRSVASRRGADLDYRAAQGELGSTIDRLNDCLSRLLAVSSPEGENRGLGVVVAGNWADCS